MKKLNIEKFFAVFFKKNSVNMLILKLKTDNFNKLLKKNDIKIIFLIFTRNFILILSSSHIISKLI